VAIDQEHLDGGGGGVGGRNGEEGVRGETW
jgi:hypothetical protein